MKLARGRKRNYRSDSWHLHVLKTSIIICPGSFASQQIFVLRTSNFRLAPVRAAGAPLKLCTIHPRNFPKLPTWIFGRMESALLFRNSWKMLFHSLLEISGKENRYFFGRTESAPLFMKFFKTLFHSSLEVFWRKVKSKFWSNRKHPTEEVFT